MKHLTKESKLLFNQMITSEKRIIKSRSGNFISVEYPNFRKMKSVSLTDFFTEKIVQLHVSVLITPVPVCITVKNWYLKIIKGLRGSWVLIPEFVKCQCYGGLNEGDDEFYLPLLKSCKVFSCPEPGNVPVFGGPNRWQWAGKCRIANCINKINVLKTFISLQCI